jgi:hypothetical protein
MSPERKQEVRSNILIAVATFLVTFTAAWGATVQRIAQLERDVASVYSEVGQFRVIASRLEIAAARMEQIVLDYDRRISRLEK